MTVAEMYVTYFRARLRAPNRSEAGASLVEYAMLLALIVVVCVAAVNFVGQATQSSLSSSASRLD